jgi:hypothetical protein
MLTSVVEIPFTTGCPTVKKENSAPELYVEFEVEYLTSI